MGGATRRFMVCGAGGLLGRAVGAACRAAGHDLLALARADLDAADEPRVRFTISAWRPEVVINCVAYTDVDGAQRQPSLANAGNAATAASLARATAAAGIELIHLSTDHVFDGRLRRPYRIDDPPRPLSVYGASKLAGEEWVQRLQPRAWIVRTSGLFGAGGRNFVDAIARRAIAGEPLRVVSDQVCARTHADDLAAGLVELATARPAYGTYHVTNEGAGSWYEFARQIAEGLGSRSEIMPVSSAEYGAPAPRPAYSVLDTVRWQMAGLTPLRSIAGALGEHLRAQWLAAEGPSDQNEETGDA